jgi:TPR repeat protein
MAAPLANAKRAPKPTASRKPSPAKHATAAAEDSADSPGAVSADCEKQLPSLRRASARGDAKARASLGLIYYAGRCVPRDLPTAYRWYALALRTAPDSPQVAAQLEAIWKQMSPAERQLAQKPQ